MVLSWLTLLRCRGWPVDVVPVARCSGLPGPADPVQRQFTAERPDQVWCGDVTMIHTGKARCIWPR